VDESEDELLPEINPEKLPQLIEKLGSEETAYLISAGILSVSKQHSGPLPSSEEFARYEQTHHGAADRILSYMEREQSFQHAHMECEQKFRQEIARKEQNDLNWETIHGQVLGFLGLSGLIGGAIVSVCLKAHPIVPITFIGAAAMGAIKAFIDGRTKPKKDD